VRKWILVLLLLMVVVACASGGRRSPVKSTATPKSPSFHIEVWGWGSGFQGSYGGLNSSGQYVSKSVEGRIPQDYYFIGSSVSCVFQKKSEWGTLGVSIYRDGKLVAEESTDAAYGVVSIATE